MNWADYFVAVMISLPILATFVLGLFLAWKGTTAIGKPTINPTLFYSGKFLLFAIWAVFCFIAFFPAYRSFVPFLIQNKISDIQKLVAGVFLIPANLIIVPAYLKMGLVHD